MPPPAPPVPIISGWFSIASSARAHLSRSQPFLWSFPRQGSDRRGFPQICFYWNCLCSRRNQSKPHLARWAGPSRKTGAGDTTCFFPHCRSAASHFATIWFALRSHTKTLCLIYSYHKPRSNIFLSASQGTFGGLPFTRREFDWPKNKNSCRREYCTSENQSGFPFFWVAVFCKNLQIWNQFFFFLLVFVSIKLKKKIPNFIKIAVQIFYFIIQKIA